MSKKINTLIVDDEYAWRFDLNKLAEKAGITKISQASSENEADYFMKKNNYQLMLLDTQYGSTIMGPNIAKKAFENRQSPKIIALSANADNEKFWKNQDFDYEFFDKQKFNVENLKSILEEMVK